MSNFWSGWIILFSLANILAMWWLLRVTAKRRPGDAEEQQTTGHSWDGITEYNKPLPRWWLWFFYITIVFSLVYLALYPGLGKFAGTLGWTQHQAYNAELQAADAKYGELYRTFADTNVEQLSEDPRAMQMGQRLFLNYCAQCHGSDARGAVGFPNLADDDWLYGSSAEDIKQTILHGRSGMMPPLGTALGDEGVRQVIQYIRQLGGQQSDDVAAAAGQETFAVFCAGCHGVDGTGNSLFGAPNLSDTIWLYGGSDEALYQTIMKGRNGKMPAQKNTLGDDKIHLLSAYIYSLSGN